MNLVTDERLKLTAGLVNTVAGFALTAGGLGPLIAVSYGVSAAPSVSVPLLCLIAGIWLGVGIDLHLGARHLLGRSRP